VGVVAQSRPTRQPRKPQPRIAAPARTADLIVLNGKVLAGADQAGWAEAIAIKGDRITAVGRNAEIRRVALPQARIIDAGGRLVVPGFNDAHVHLVAMPEGEWLPQGTGEGPPPDPNFKEVLALVEAAAKAAPAGRWIFGTIGSTVLDDVEATRFGLDEVSPQHPVLLRAWTGHGTFFNTQAMKLLGLTDREPDPPGGFYTRLRQGGNRQTLSGFAHEYAEYRIAQKLHAMAGEAAFVEAVREQSERASRFGITSVQALVDDAQKAAALLAEVELPVRVRLMTFSASDPASWQPATSPADPASPMLTVSGTKWILDGTPVERLAYLRQSYADRNGWRGAPNFRLSAFDRLLSRALEAREPVLVHAVGDAALDQLFGGMQRAGSPLRWQSRRLRIEHGDLLAADLFDEAVRFGVVLVQNPSHFALPILRARLGADRLARIDSVKSAVAAGVPLALGSDGPLNPFLNIMLAAQNPANPPEALTVAQAVRAYTAGSAYAEFLEKEKGAIAPGMLADIAILSQDIFESPLEQLPATTSALTIVGGRVVHGTQP
jgi:predicted amidohydrolase YtcJ